MHIHASFLIPKKGGLYHLLSFFIFSFSLSVSQFSQKIGFYIKYLYQNSTDGVFGQNMAGAFVCKKIQLTCIFYYRYAGLRS